jgi:hypothetical protein
MSERGPLKLAALAAIGGGLLRALACFFQAPTSRLKIFSSSIS